MAKCKDCVRFPWKPGASLFQLPAVKCHPDLPRKRFMAEHEDENITCPYFEEIPKPKKTARKR